MPAVLQRVNTCAASERIGALFLRTCITRRFRPAHWGRCSWQGCTPLSVPRRNCEQATLCLIAFRRMALPLFARGHFRLLFRTLFSLSVASPQKKAAPASIAAGQQAIPSGVFSITRSSGTRTDDLFLDSLPRTLRALSRRVTPFLLLPTIQMPATAS